MSDVTEIHRRFNKEMCKGSIGKGLCYVCQFDGVMFKIKNRTLCLECTAKYEIGDVEVIQKVSL